MIRENDEAREKTFAYAYDQGGNLLSVKEYAYTTGALPETPVKTVTGTYDATWKDKLLTWDGTAMTYDVIGNMLTKGSTAFSWQGRKLMGVENGKSIQYSYDHTGARTKKVVDDVVTEYVWQGIFWYLKRQTARPTGTAMIPAEIWCQQRSEDLSTST